MPKYSELLLCSSLRVSLTGYFIRAWSTICDAGMNLNERLYPAGGNPCKGFLALSKLLLPLPLGNYLFSYVFFVLVFTTPLAHKQIRLVH